MDNLPFEVRRIIIDLIPEVQLGPLRATSRALLAQIGAIMAESVQHSPASFSPDRVYSMVNWLRKSRVPADQKYRIVLKHMPRRGIIRWMLRHTAPTPVVITKFADTIISLPGSHYSRAERARVLALFGQNTDRNAKIAAMTGVIDLIYVGTNSCGILSEAVKFGNDEAAYLLADRSTTAAVAREYVRGEIARRNEHAALRARIAAGTDALIRGVRTGPPPTLLS